MRAEFNRVHNSLGNLMQQGQPKLVHVDQTELTPRKEAWDNT